MGRDERDETVAELVQPEPEKIEGRRSNASRQNIHHQAPKILAKGKGPPPPPKNPRGAAHWNYGRNLTRGWAGTPGPVGDPRSRAAKLARRIQREELVPQYGEPDGVGLETLMFEVAAYRALARLTLFRIGLDKDATSRNATRLSRMAAAKEQELAKISGLRKPWQPTSGLELAASLEAERAKDRKKTPEDRRPR
jgi:hypothetical protein